MWVNKKMIIDNDGPEDSKTVAVFCVSVAVVLTSFLYVLWSLVSWLYVAFS